MAARLAAWSRTAMLTPTCCVPAVFRGPLSIYALLDSCAPEAQKFFRQIEIGLLTPLELPL